MRPDILRAIAGLTFATLAACPPLLVGVMGLRKGACS